MFRATVAVVLLALIAVPTQAWWCTGHMTIAQIAKSKMSSGALAKAESIIGSLSNMGPFPMIPTFIQAACWADDLKRNTGEMRQWHFLNLPYDPSNYPIVLDPQEENVASEITQFSQSVKWTENGENAWQLAFSLGNLIHFYGDISQPLHVTELFSSQFPTGDKGGNLYKIVYNGTTQPLHAYWDAICNQYMTELKRPLSDSSREIVENLAQQYLDTYNISEAEAKVYNSTVMSQESYSMAVKYAYAGITVGGTPSQQYFDNCADIAGYQITLAGLRLGNELEYLFKDSRSVTVKRINERVDELHREYSRHVSMRRQEHNAKVEAMKKRK